MLLNHSIEEIRGKYRIMEISLEEYFDYLVQIKQTEDIDEIKESFRSFLIDISDDITQNEAIFDFFTECFDTIKTKSVRLLALQNIGKHFPERFEEMFDNIQKTLQYTSSFLPMTGRLLLKILIPFDPLLIH